MKKLLFIFILAALTVVSMATAQTKKGAIRPEYTMLSKPMAFTAADSLAGNGGHHLVTSDSLVILVSNSQKYFQHVTFTTTLANHSGATAVTITARGKVTATDSWHPIGSAVSWTGTNPGIITSTVPANYNYYRISYVSSGATQNNVVSAFEAKTSNAFEVPTSAGTVTFSRPDAGTVTLQVADNNANAAAVYRAGGTGALTLGASTGSTTLTSSGTVAVTVSNVEIGATSANETTPSLKIIGDADSDAGGDTDETLTIDLTANATPTSATWAFTSTQSAGYTFDKKIVGSGGFTSIGPINYAITGGTSVASAGLLGGGGTATNATQTLGSAGGKAFSYYLSSTSATASHVLTGYYMNVNYGATGGATAAPSGDVIRGRAYLMGDASGTSALTGGAFSVELEATTASNTGLTVGMRGNIVLPDGVLTNSGTYYGTEGEIFLGGAATDTRAYTTIAPIGIVIGGTPATAAAQLDNIVAMDISVPANMVTSDGTLVVTGATGVVAAGLKIKINGTYYWIMLATADE